MNIIRTQWKSGRYLLMTSRRDYISKQTTLMICFLAETKIIKWMRGWLMWYFPICTLTCLLSSTAVKYCLNFNCSELRYSLMYLRKFRGTILFQTLKEMYYTLFSMQFILFIIHNVLAEIHYKEFYKGAEQMGRQSKEKYHAEQAVKGLSESCHGRLWNTL